MDFSNTTNGILEYINSWENKLHSLPKEVISNRYNSQKRSIKQILGHLIDSAANNHQRMIRLQYNKNLNFPDYQQDNDLWISLQDYQHAEWNNTINLWKFYNLHMIQIISSIDESKLQNTWSNFEGNSVTLEQMINGYLRHMQLHFNEIHELIDA